jgi:hypothetical protein
LAREHTRTTRASRPLFPREPASLSFLNKSEIHFQKKEKWKIKSSNFFIEFAKGRREHWIKIVTDLWRSDNTWEFIEGVSPETSGFCKTIKPLLSEATRNLLMCIEFIEHGVPHEKNQYYNDMKDSKKSEMPLSFLNIWNKMGGDKMCLEEQIAAVDILYHETIRTLQFLGDIKRCHYLHTATHGFQFLLVFGPAINFSSSILERFNAVYKKFMRDFSNKKASWGREPNFDGASPDRANPDRANFRWNYRERTLALTLEIETMEMQFELDKVKTPTKEGEVYAHKDKKKIVWRCNEQAKICENVREFLNEQHAMNEQGSLPSDARASDIARKTGIQIVYDGPVQRFGLPERLLRSQTQLERATQSSSQSENATQSRSQPQKVPHSTPNNILFSQPSEDHVLRRDMFNKLLANNIQQALEKDLKKRELGELRDVLSRHK